MARCKKCDGRGWYENPRYPNPASWNYAGEPTIKCGKCKATGYVIGDVEDVLSHLKHLAQSETNRERLSILKKCIAVIEEY